MKRLLIFLCFLSLSAFAQNVKTFIPEKAHKYLPTLKTEVDTYFPEIETPEYFGGLAEQESCISLRHKKCWDPSSQLLTSREQGSGLFQITRAYRTDGSVRFDSLSDLRKAHMQELKELSWSNVVQRPDLQIRGMLLMTKDNYKGLYPVKVQIERLKMTDAAYNAGPGSVRKRRLQCGLTKGCDPQIWDHNVSTMKTLSEKPIYGNRSPNFINLEHVEMIFHFRMDKYKPYLRKQ